MPESQITENHKLCHCQRSPRPTIRTYSVLDLILSMYSITFSHTNRLCIVGIMTTVLMQYSGSKSKKHRSGGVLRQTHGNRCAPAQHEINVRENHPVRLKSCKVHVQRFAEIPPMTHHLREQTVECVRWKPVVYGLPDFTAPQFARVVPRRICFRLYCAPGRVHAAATQAVVRLPEQDQACIGRMSQALGLNSS